MNEITKLPASELGYNFIDPKYIPENMDEYYIRFEQNSQIFGKEKVYRRLRAREIETLVQNNNTSDDWNNIYVTAAFDPDLVIGCHFFGLVRIGKLEPYYLEFHNLRMKVGLYSSTIVSCDLGDNVVINNVNYMAHYIVDNETIIVNVDELSTSPMAKFGNGILREDEEEYHRIWLEIRNENAGRKVLPFNGMLPGDAFLWSKYRADDELLEKLKKFTEDRFTKRRGYYGVIGKRCVIKYSKTIKDTLIGDDAYIKGANKLKNLTINSSPELKTQVGEGCEMVNGIIGYGCRVFYGVKAVRFIMDTNSNLKYGARLINSYLGCNATISCCEVLNSLIFPAHEQHHNNSFLCAALLMGQSNIAAGCTIGSNHNSRSADGEMVVGRGFWPGLSVTLKHNSKFATFTLISKGDYPSEINLPLPFSLLINDVGNDRLLVMPGYWFMYNMYALTRNSWKLSQRDQRIVKTHKLEYDTLAPDSVEEMLSSLKLLEEWVGEAANTQKEDGKIESQEELRQLGRQLLEESPEKVARLKVFAKGLENSKRSVEILKSTQAYLVFKRMISYYGLRELFKALKSKDSLESEMVGLFRKAQHREWTNMGGQLMLVEELERLRADIKSGKIKDWDEVHNRYVEYGATYENKKRDHGLAVLLQVKGIDTERVSRTLLKNWIKEFEETSVWILQQTKASREKDYTNPYRSMVYDSVEEMQAVLGKFEEDGFIHKAVENHENNLRLAKKIRSLL